MSLSFTYSLLSARCCFELKLIFGITHSQRQRRWRWKRREGMKDFLDFSYLLFSFITVWFSFFISPARASLARPTHHHPLWHRKFSISLLLRDIKFHFSTLRPLRRPFLSLKITNNNDNYGQETENSVIELNLNRFSLLRDDGGRWKILFSFPLSNDAFVTAVEIETFSAQLSSLLCYYYNNVQLPAVDHADGCYAAVSSHFYYSPTS